MSKAPYSIFSVIGLEIEYMLVDRDTLNVQPKSDQIIAALANGALVNEVNLGEIAISNELVMHVLELKNNGPRPTTEPLGQYFQKAINDLQPLLKQHHLYLLPSGAHPWMNPSTETTRWPHGNRSIYQQYDKIFNCQGHGWSNLQSMHVNLPFANDEEFGALHNTVRLLLPLLPALAASTPVLDGKATGQLDSRLFFYETNQQRMPSISGKIIPEYIKSQAEYEECILEPMYREIAPHDPERILQEEWLNSRAAIPKFEYGALEIRIIDSQECVNADIAIARVIHALIKHWCDSGYYPTPPHVDTHHLKNVFDKTIHNGFKTIIDDRTLLAAWQLPQRSMNTHQVWSHLIEQVSHQLTHEDQIALEHILRHGNLSERILRACQQDTSKSTLKQVYHQLAQCLLNNQQFKPS